MHLTDRVWDVGGWGRLAGCNPSWHTWEIQKHMGMTQQAQTSLSWVQKAKRKSASPVLTNMAGMHRHGPHSAPNSGAEHTHHVVLVDIPLSWQHDSLCSRRWELVRSVRKVLIWRWAELPDFDFFLVRWYLASFISWVSAKLSHFELAVSNILWLLKMASWHYWFYCQLSFDLTQLCLFLYHIWYHSWYNKALISSSSLPGTCWVWVLLSEGVCLLGTVQFFA